MVVVLQRPLINTVELGYLTIRWDIRLWDRAFPPEKLKIFRAKNVITYITMTNSHGIVRSTSSEMCNNISGKVWSYLNTSQIYCIQHWSDIKVWSHLLYEVLGIAVRSGDVRGDCVYTFGHNFLIICLIFKLFFQIYRKITSISCRCWGP